MLRQNLFNHSFFSLQKKNIIHWSATTSTSVNWMQKRYTATSTSPTCELVVDKKLGVCFLNINGPLDSKTWRAVNIVLRAHNFSWEKENKRWKAPSTDFAEKTALQVQTFIADMQTKTQLTSSTSVKDMKKMFVEWADKEDKFILEYLNRVKKHRESGDTVRADLFLREIFSTITEGDGSVASDKTQSTSEIVMDKPLEVVGEHTALSKKEVEPHPVITTSREDVDKFLSSITDMINRLLPSHIQKSRFKAALAEDLHRQENLFALDRTSIRKTVCTAALFGLEPGYVSAQCYFVPIDGKLRFIIGYRGLMDLAFRSQNILFFSAKCVYREDQFSEVNGIIRHTPHPNAQERGPITCAYAICFFESGEKKRVVLSDSKLKRMKKVTKDVSDPNSVWYKWNEEMRVKAAVKELIRENMTIDLEMRGCHA